MGTRSASRLGYTNLSKTPTSALYTNWFLQTLLFGISKEICNRLISSFWNLRKMQYCKAENWLVEVIILADLEIPRIEQTVINSFIIHIHMHSYCITFECFFLFAYWNVRDFSNHLNFPGYITAVLPPSLCHIYLAFLIFGNCTWTMKSILPRWASQNSTDGHKRSAEEIDDLTVTT